MFSKSPKEVAETIKKEKYYRLDIKEDSEEDKVFTELLDNLLSNDSVDSEYIEEKLTQINSISDLYRLYQKDKLEDQTVLIEQDNGNLIQNELMNSGLDIFTELEGALTAIAGYMFQNDKSHISIADLKQIANENAHIMPYFLDKCPLIIKDENNNYQFKFKGIYNYLFVDLVDRQSQSFKL